VTNLFNGIESFGS